MSRNSLPKQFQYILGEQTPFQHMLKLLQQVIPLENIMVMAVPEFRHLILEQVPGFPEENILFEPARRDTGPAVLLGMLQIEARDPNALVATVWSDHLVLDETMFANVLRAGFATAEANPEQYVTVGAKPTKADTSLGYIQMGSTQAEYSSIEVRKVKRFVEKPDQATANQFFQSTSYLWNVGYNVTYAHTFRKQFIACNPDLSDATHALQTACQQEDATAITATYEVFPKKSIDYLLVEKIQDIAVVPADMGWSDIGTWNTLHQMMSNKTGNDLVSQGPVTSKGSRNSLAFAKDTPIILVGVTDTIVVDTGDAILVMSNQAPASELKSIIQDSVSQTNPELL
jgi:mannose-1-phosphate guanylyltransferase